MTSEERRNAAKKRRREARKHGENVQKRNRIRWKIFTPPGPRIVKICMDCMGTCWGPLQSVKPLRFEPCAACDGTGGTLTA